MYKIININAYDIQYVLLPQIKISANGIRKYSKSTIFIFLSMKYNKNTLAIQHIFPASLCPESHSP